MDRRCGRGGIRWLLELIEEHRGPLEYDWRTRFGLPLDAVGTRAMSWGEACRLVVELASDPDTHTAAALARWEHPWSREAALLADLWDITAAANSKDRPKPYPRPWRVTSPDVTRHVPDVSGMTQEQVRAQLARMSGRG